MTIEQLQELLAHYNLSPSKKLGQNFLLDDFLLQDIVDGAGVKPGQAILEVGPGIANLTQHLIATGNFVLSVDKDPRFTPLLSELARKHKNFKFEIDDILKFNFQEALKKFDSYVVVANIPYYVTGKIIQLFVNAEKKPESLTVLVQKEVAENITAGVGDLNLLALSVQLVADAKFVLPVPAEKFYPKPKVDSAVVRIEFLDQPRFPEMDRKFLFRVLRACFSGKRKQIHNTLTNNLKLPRETVEAVLQKVFIGPELRPQQISLESWVKLAKELQPLLANS
jgi:16S rRNA (adenine1518-N6/adenine1519-N6)-dimethyltransferase